MSLVYITLVVDLEHGYKTQVGSIPCKIDFFCFQVQDNKFANQT